MLVFDGTKRDELEKWLFFSHIQDAVVELFELDEKQKVLRVSAFHPVFEEAVSLSLTGVTMTVLRGRHVSSNPDRILSVTVLHAFHFVFHGKVLEIDTGIPLVFELNSGQIAFITAAKVLVNSEKRETFFEHERWTKEEMSISIAQNEKKRKNFAKLRCHVV